jgi:hypothetical protein
MQRRHWFAVRQMLLLRRLDCAAVPQCWQKAGRKALIGIVLPGPGGVRTGLNSKSCTSLALLPGAIRLPFGFVAGKALAASHVLFSAIIGSFGFAFP